MPPALWLSMINNRDDGIFITKIRFKIRCLLWFYVNDFKDCTIEWLHFTQVNGTIIQYDHMYVWSSTWSIGQPKLSGGTPETSWSVLEKTNFSIVLVSHHQHDQIIGAFFIISILNANSPVITILTILDQHDDDDDHLQTAALSSLQEECFHDPSVESMKTQAAPSPACLLRSIDITSTQSSSLSSTSSSS